MYLIHKICTFSNEMKNKKMDKDMKNDKLSSEREFKTTK